MRPVLSRPCALVALKREQAPPGRDHQCLQPLARRMLVEGAWTKPTASMDLGTDEAPPRHVRNTAWTAQLRLCAVCSNLQAAGHRPQVVGMAIARVMAPFAADA
jgi:hypothetical protein